MKTEIRTITPEDAKSLLNYNTGNRKIRKQSVANFAKLLRLGEFQLTHQGLAFTGTNDRPGRLLDGQHRLMAINESGIPAQMMICWKCPESVFEVIDGGLTRSFSDHYGWTKDKISTIKALLNMALCGIPKMTKHEADSLYSAFGHEYEMLLTVAPTQRAKLASAPIKGAVIVLMKRHPGKNYDIAKMYRSLTLENFSEMAPSIQRLFARLIEIPGGGQQTSILRAVLTTKAFTPANWTNSKLVLPKDVFAEYAKIGEYVKTQAGI
jgi:hypothetical protein